MPRRPSTPTPDELEFQDALKLHLGASPHFRWWRQNSGSVPIRDRSGATVRYFHAGPPKGAADLSGIVMPEGWRLEVELKSATGTRSAEQIRWGEFILASGGVYALVAYDADRSLAQNLELAASVILAAIARRRAA